MDQLTVRLVVDVLIWVPVLAVVIAVAVYIAKKTRSGSENQESTTSEMLSKFRDLHSQGQLNDTEFRTIKTALAERMRREFNDSGQSG
jgi:uncharacterized membrane protein